MYIPVLESPVQLDPGDVTTCSGLPVNCSWLGIYQKVEIKKIRLHHQRMDFILTFDL
jgi:hypothetical protein